MIYSAEKRLGIALILQWRWWCLWLFSSGRVRMGRSAFWGLELTFTIVLMMLSRQWWGWFFSNHMGSTCGLSMPLWWSLCKVWVNRGSWELVWGDGFGETVMDWLRGDSSSDGELGTHAGAHATGCCFHGDGHANSGALNVASALCTRAASQHAQLLRYGFLFLQLHDQASKRIYNYLCMWTLALILREGIVPRLEYSPVGMNCNLLFYFVDLAQATFSNSPGDCTFSFLFLLPDELRIK